MERLALLLLLTVSLSSTLLVLVDKVKCAHIRCQWRGEGEHCKPSLSLREGYRQLLCSPAFRFHFKGETEADLIRRIKRIFPVNTFTIDDVELGEECAKRKELCCNADHADIYKDYAEYLEYLRSSGSSIASQRQCSAQPIPYPI